MYDKLDREVLSRAIEVIKASIYRFNDILSSPPDTSAALDKFLSNKVDVEVVEDPGHVNDFLDGEAYYTPFGELLETGLQGGRALCKPLSKEDVARLDMGVIYADSVSLDTGTIFIAHPYKYIPLSTHARRLVVVAGEERLFNSFIDAFRVAHEISLLHRERVNIGAISSPSRTGDIEKRVVYGAHGPREVKLLIIKRGFLKPYRLYLIRYLPRILGLEDCEAAPLMDPFLSRPYIEGLDNVYRGFFREWGYDIELVGEGLRWRSLET